MVSIGHCHDDIRDHMADEGLVNKGMHRRKDLLSANKSRAIYVPTEIRSKERDGLFELMAVDVTDVFCQHADALALDCSQLLSIHDATSRSKASDNYPMTLSSSLTQ